MAPPKATTDATSQSQPVVRPATEADVGAIRDLFHAAYGDNYAHPEYYDTAVLKKLTYSDNSLLLVAAAEGKVLGTASVVMHVGAYSDLVGEFGRLVVSPEARGRGVGQLLMDGRISFTQDRLHVGIVENRTGHPYSQKISAEHGFANVGLLPDKLLTDHRESLSLYARYFGDALELRRNHPHLIPEAAALAELSMRNLGLTPDAIVDVASAPYALEEGFEIEQFDTHGYAALLRLERGRVHEREIVGPLKLHYGLFQLHESASTYLIARQGERLAGAIGFSRDRTERTLRVFELISASERPIRFLLERLLEYCRREGDVDYIEIDVTAHAPRMQRTLWELGFQPCAYVPALTFQQCERLDVVKMIYVFAEPDFSDLHLAEQSLAIGEAIQTAYAEAPADAEILAAAAKSPMFLDLNDEQTHRLAGAMQVRKLAAGEALFAAGDPASELYLVVTGELEILLGDDEATLARLEPGACIGQRSLLLGELHTHAARAVAATEVGVLSGAALDHFVRRRPDIGVVLYRNLARELREDLG